MKIIRLPPRPEVRGFTLTGDKKITKNVLLTAFASGVQTTRIALNSEGKHWVLNYEIIYGVPKYYGLRSREINTNNGEHDEIHPRPVNSNYCWQY